MKTECAIYKARGFKYLYLEQAHLYKSEIQGFEITRTTGVTMDLYTIWADKEGDITDLEWVNGMKSFFDHLISEGKMESYRITRCKMGFRSIADMPEWMIIMEFNDMGQMDSAFKRVAPLEGELEVKHKSFNQFVSGNIQHALFRDWPDNYLN
jgi:hypothetical protein